MKVTIIGGGNLGTLMAATFAYRGHEVTIRTSKPEKFSKVSITFQTDSQTA